MKQFSASPKTMVSNLWNNRTLILALIQREVLGRYRGSILGILWSFFNPALMLIIYTFVFSVVFKARWHAGSDSRAEFALVLFAGLILFNLFSECINRAPNIILTHVSYVKKVVFPLEILSCVVLGSALFHATISLGVWFIFYIIFFGTLPHATALLAPFILLPVVFITTGLSWVLASLGVYLRDISQLMGVLTTITLFLSPIFYPISSLPAQYRPFLQCNPLSLAIEEIREVLYWGTTPNLLVYGLYLAVTFLFCWLGFVWFQKTRRWFADVL